jgi:enamine deaminase RidA (YjgF/YER057c/UK114 family)
MMSAIKYIDPRGLLESKTFSQVVTTTGSRMIFTSGQVAVNERGEVVGAGDLAKQTQQAMRNLTVALHAADATFADVVKTTTYVVNYKPEHRQIITDAKHPFYDSAKPPASALIGVSALAKPEWLIEIEAIAVLS